MGTIFIDGFDKYGPVGQSNPTAASLIAQEWTSVNGATIAAPLSSSGTALNFLPTNGAFSINKTLPGNYTRLIGGFRFTSNLTSTFGIVFQDASTAQSSISINQSTGIFTAHTGALAGTALANSVFAMSANTTHYLEWDFTFGAAANYQVWCDGASIISGTGNTKATANSYANNISIQVVPFGSMSYTIDDFYLFDTTGTTNNAVLLTSPRIETRYPTADVQTQWSNVASVLGPTSPAGGNQNPASNRMILRRYVNPVACSLQSVSCLPQNTAGAAKYKAVVYADSAGSPVGQTLLASGNEVVGTVLGTVLTSTLTVPLSLTAGTAYWLGFIYDSTLFISLSDSLAVGVFSFPTTYTSGPPGTCPSVTFSQSSYLIYGTCTGMTTNWQTVALNPAPGSVSTISSSTPTNEDLYTFPALSTSAANVYTVAVKGNIRKSDTGTRTVDLRLKSGSTDSGGSTTGQSPSTSFAWMDSYFDKDPSTNATWTYSAVNSAVAGAKVAS